MYQAALVYDYQLHSHSKQCSWKGWCPDFIFGLQVYPWLP